MGNTKKSNNIKYRSYSRIFSSNSFTNLLKFDDFTFINNRIIKYDADKLGNAFITYSDYIKYIYKELRQNYQNEYIYKNTFINEMLIKRYGIKNTIAINEFSVGSSKADIVLFNGSSKVFEIKTQLDSDYRLKKQMDDYCKIFNECYIVTHSSLVDKYLKFDNKVGIIELSKHPRSLKMKEIRPALKNEEIDSKTIIRALRTYEYLNITKSYYGNLPEMNSFNMFEICENLFEKIPNKSLNELFIKQVKLRKTNTGLLRSFSPELRQLILSMNLTNAKIDNLNTKLSKPIRI